MDVGFLSSVTDGRTDPCPHGTQRLIYAPVSRVIGRKTSNSARGFPAQSVSIHVGTFGRDNRG